MSKLSRPTTLILIGLASLIVMAGVLIRGGLEKPSISSLSAPSIAELFIDRIVSGKYGSAYELTTGNQQAGSSRDAFVRRYKQQMDDTVERFGYGRYREKKILDTETHGSVVETIYELRYESGKQSFYIWLIQGDEGWRVYTCRIISLAPGRRFFTPTPVPIGNVPVS